MWIPINRRVHFFPSALASIDAYCSPTKDEKYLDTLLLTFRSFVRPADFFEYLMSMFNAELPADPSPADLQYFDMVKEPTQQRVTEVIERWVSNFWHDFDQSASLMEDLNSFMEQLEQAGAGYAEASRFIANEVERQVRHSIDEWQ